MGGDWSSEVVKGVILDCVRDLVRTKFGDSAWKQILDGSELASSSFIASANVSEEKFHPFLRHVAEVLELKQDALFKAFAAHWVHVYSPRMYKIFYQQVTSARDFIVSIDNIHETMTMNIADATPPRFTYQWTDDRTLVIQYRSSRNLAELACALLVEIGVKYDEPLTARVLDDTKIVVTFFAKGPTPLPSR